MTKYIFAYHGGHGMPESAEEIAEIVSAWEAWFGGMGEALLDGGNPTGENCTINSDSSVSAGGGANPIGGYSLIQADSMDAAVAIAKGCPMLGAGGSVEVAQAFDM